VDTADGTLLTKDAASVRLPELVDVDYAALNVAAAQTFLLMIDRDNGSGAYKHVAGDGIKVATIDGVLIKSSASAMWLSLFGIILAIDGTNATIAYLRFGSVLAQDNAFAQTSYSYSALPARIDCTVAGGGFTKIAAGFVEVTALVNTGITLPNVLSAPTTPAVGDAVIKLVRASGSGTAIIHYSVLYEVS
jgi:hypothetical protein